MFWESGWFLHIVYSVICVAIFLKIYNIFSKGKCKSFTCLTGKTALITGGNSGIGYEVALTLASRGCRVIIADVTDGTKTKDKIISETCNENITYVHLDLASFKSVRQCAQYVNQTESRLDFLINNAGIGCTARKASEDKLPYIIQVNFFGHFLLTHLLIDLLKKSSPSRIIFTSSLVSFFGGFSLDKLRDTEADTLYDVFVSLYGISKFSINIAVVMLAKKLKDAGVTCNTLHPGLVCTNIFNKNMANMKTTSKFLQYTAWSPRIPAFWFGKTAEEGAQTILHLVLASQLETVSGRFFVDCSSRHWMSYISYLKYTNLSAGFRTDFWNLCEELVGLSDNEKLGDLRKNNGNKSS